MDESQPSSSTADPQWKPLTAKQRRVLGTLMEKSKTTPDVYPMTFKGLMTGCNQKSNRTPFTNYTEEQIENIVDELRTIGAVTIVQGSGRVTKVRHYAYNWLGISKVEGAIMTELLLRGEQTLGELRTRASRMEPIADIEELKRLFDDLKRRNLVVELSPPGRGQIVSHNVYPEWELEALRKSIAAGTSSVALDDEGSETSTVVSHAAGNTSHAPTISSPAHTTRVDALQAEIGDLREQIAKLIERIGKLEREIGIEASND